MEKMSSSNLWLSAGLDQRHTLTTNNMYAGYAVCTLIKFEHFEVIIEIKSK